MAALGTRVDMDSMCLPAAASRFARAAAELFECPRPPGATVSRWRLERYLGARQQRRGALCGAGELDGASVDVRVSSS